jgi:hypothetical protein
MARPAASQVRRIRMMRMLTTAFCHGCKRFSKSRYFLKGVTFLSSHRFGDFFQGRELLEADKSKLLKKLERRPVNDGAPNLLKATQVLNEAMVDECPDHAIRVDAAYGFDLRTRDGLAIGDDGQRLQGGG